MRKPFHKHIAHHLRKYHRHITKYLYERDTIFATLWVFIFIVVVKFLPIGNLHFLDPMKLALEDFDFNDIAYSKLKKVEKDSLDSRIVIVNIGHADREQIAYLIEKTASLQPAVMGLDATFEGAKDPVKDSLLNSVFKKTKNLVGATRIDFEENGKGHYIPGYFFSSLNQTGFVNLIGKENATVRLFFPYYKLGDSVYNSFAAMLVKNYSPDAFQRLQRRKQQYEVINYSRRIPNQYLVVQPDDLLDGTAGVDAIKGKIVLLGYVNMDKDDIEDKKFTPMNDEFAGKSVPDMNGIVVHANTISMILDHRYIKELPSWVNIVIAVLIGWLHMSFFIRYYLENHIWFHLVVKFAQLLSAIFFVYLGIALFTKFDIKLDMSLTLIVIVLSVDIIYFYEAFAVWMHKKYGYKTVFHQKQH